jgi:hypothetical protein
MFKIYKRKGGPSIKSAISPEGYVELFRPFND